MGLFGRRGRRDRHADEPQEWYEQDAERDSTDTSNRQIGPFDESEAPQDDVSRLDLGSVRLPVPDGAQLQVELYPAGPVRAVHVVTPYGQVTVRAYAAPRSGGKWEEMCGELAEHLRAQGATVRSEVGEWGQELVAAVGEVALRFVGVDGPRWMLRGEVAGPPDRAPYSTAALRELVRGTIVVRGSMPMPAGDPLPIKLPDALAAQIAQSQDSGGPG